MRTRLLDTDTLHRARTIPKGWLAVCVAAEGRMIPPTRLLDSEFLTSPLFFFFSFLQTPRLCSPRPRWRLPAGAEIQQVQRRRHRVELRNSSSSARFLSRCKVKPSVKTVSPVIQKLSRARSAAHLFVLLWFLHFHLDLFPWNHAVLALLSVLQILRQKKWNGQVEI